MPSYPHILFHPHFTSTSTITNTITARHYHPLRHRQQPQPSPSPCVILCRSFLNTLTTLKERNVEIAIVTQCQKGAVYLETYATGRQLTKLGLINAKDM